MVPSLVFVLLLCIYPLSIALEAGSFSRGHHISLHARHARVFNTLSARSADRNANETDLAASHSVSSDEETDQPDLDDVCVNDTDTEEDSTSAIGNVDAQKPSQAKPTTSDDTPSKATNSSNANSRDSPYTIASPNDAAVQKYGQCGGVNYQGATTCDGGWVCLCQHQYYSQCLPSEFANSGPSGWNQPSCRKNNGPPTDNGAPLNSSSSGNDTASHAALESKPIAKPIVPENTNEITSNNDTGLLPTNHSTHTSAPEEPVNSATPVASASSIPPTAKGNEVITEGSNQGSTEDNTTDDNESDTSSIAGDTPKKQALFTTKGNKGAIKENASGSGEDGASNLTKAESAPGSCSVFAGDKSFAGGYATTTHYAGDGGGSCGCENGIANNIVTAAGNSAIFNNGGDSSWCGEGCGTCYRLENVAQLPYEGAGTCDGAHESITVMITNYCPPTPGWCMSPNHRGFDAHFDLIDNGLAGKNWNNPVVKFEKVDCPADMKSIYSKCRCGNGEKKPKIRRSFGDFDFSEKGFE